MLKQFITTLAKIPQDKLLHYFVGSLLAIISLPLGMTWSWIVVAGIALIRELVGNRDPIDFLATVVGAAPVWAAYLLGGVK